MLALMVEPSSPARNLLVMSFARFAGGFWRGASARIAFWLTVSLAAGLICKLLVDVGMNRWNRWFFDALERRDTGGAALAAFAFPVLIFSVAAVGVWIIRARETLQVRWREWCAARLLERWLSNQRFYRMRVARGGVANP